MVEQLKSILSKYIKDTQLLKDVVREVFDLDKRYRMEYRNDIQRLNIQLQEIERKLEECMSRDAKDYKQISIWYRNRLKACVNTNENVGNIASKCLEEVEKEFGVASGIAEQGDGFEN